MKWTKDSRLDVSLLTAIISHPDRQLLRNKLSFTLCSIHILFNSNEFYKFWMSCDFRWICTKNGRKWAKTQDGGPRKAGRPGTPTQHVTTSIQGQCNTRTKPLRGLDVGLIRWTERLIHGSKDPQSVQHQEQSSNPAPWSNHKRQVTTSVKRRVAHARRRLAGLALSMLKLRNEYRL